MLPELFPTRDKSRDKSRGSVPGARGAGTAAFPPNRRLICITPPTSFTYITPMFICITPPISFASPRPNGRRVPPATGPRVRARARRVPLSPGVPSLSLCVPRCPPGPCCATRTRRRISSASCAAWTMSVSAGGARRGQAGTRRGQRGDRRGHGGDRRGQRGDRRGKGRTAGKEGGKSVGKGENPRCAPLRVGLFGVSLSARLRGGFGISWFYLGC